MSKDIKKALEHCVEWDCGNCPNRDELGSGETVCRGRLLPEVLQYVSDLEAKLAESEKERELDNSFWKQECDSLQKTLVEKDKEIENLTEELDDKNFCKDFVDLYNENKLKTQMLHENCKDKISFTIQQLEKVKNKIESKVESIYKILDDLNIKIVGESTSRELNAYEEIAKDIDNQIKQLKEGK